MPRPILFLAGYRIYSISREDVGALIDICRSAGISYRDVKFFDDEARLTTSFFDSFLMMKRAKERGLEIKLIKSCGLPSLLVRYRHRYGMLIGVILSVALIVLSESVIWDIRIDGEHTLLEAEVRAVLSDCGLDIGTRRRSLDIDALENRVLIRSDDIAWISVNIIGTVAEVEIRELMLAPEGEELPLASNLVSDFDARVVGLENVKGNIAVEIGQRVRQGQLLVGGIYGDEDSGLRCVNPEGSVLGEVDRELRVEILRNESKKVYTGEVKREKYLIFFKKRIKFFSNYRNLPMSCDKIEVEEYLRSPNGVFLPIGVCEVRYLEYRYEDIERDDDTLISLADHRMDLLMSASLSDAFLLRKRLQYELLDDRIVLLCKIRCVQDIACRVPIEI